MSDKIDRRKPFRNIILLLLYDSTTIFYTSTTVVVVVVSNFKLQHFFATKNFVAGPEAVRDYFNGFSIAKFTILLLYYTVHKNYFIFYIISNYVLKLHVLYV